MTCLYRTVELIDHHDGVKPVRFCHSQFAELWVQAHCNKQQNKILDKLFQCLASLQKLICDPCSCRVQPNATCMEYVPWLQLVTLIQSPIICPGGSQLSPSAGTCMGVNSTIAVPSLRCLNFSSPDSNLLSQFWPNFSRRRHLENSHLILHCHPRNTNHNFQTHRLWYLRWHDSISKITAGSNSCSLFLWNIFCSRYKANVLISLIFPFHLSVYVINLTICIIVL